jgi:hypothetical protein
MMDLTTAVLALGVAVIAVQYAGDRPLRHMGVGLWWLALAVAATNVWALAVASAHAVAAYLLFVRAQSSLVEEEFALGERTSARVARFLTRRVEGAKQRPARVVSR